MAPITKEQVLASMDELPSFPDVVLRIMEALEDPDASLNLVTSCVERDPVLAGRVLWLANRAASNTRGGGPVNDVFTAISLVGLARVRETVLTSRIGGFLQEMDTLAGSDAFWKHSLAVSVCAMELTRFTEREVGGDVALIAGLLHDVGQLWLQRFSPDLFRKSIEQAHSENADVDAFERQHFGVDHATVGAWMVQYWGLSPLVVKAIECHHDPQCSPPTPLTATLHVSEVLSHALDLNDAAHGGVKRISGACCELLGLDWGADSHRLFGRIEARSRHMMALFQHAEGV